MRIYKNSEPYKICFHLNGHIIPSELVIIKTILLDESEFEPDSKFLENHIEIGPRNNFKTPWNSNVVQIFKRCGIKSIESIEFSTYYPKSCDVEYDNMLLTEYDSNIFLSKEFVQTFYVYDIKNFNDYYKLGFDEQDISYYHDIFSNQLQRFPTNVELYDLSQSNSEHARHWFFRGIFSLKNKNIIEKNLIDKLKTTLKNNDTALISFKDNASVIKGNLFKNFIVSNNRLIQQNDYINFSYKAETHNFPTGISPFPGASTGVGGRIRDNIACGVGGRLIGGTAGYSVGDIDQEYDYQLNSPRKILIEASNGASDYGNKIGEPLIQGFTRSYRKDFNQGRIEWLKPIMFSGGMGRIFNKDCDKKEGKFGDLIVRIGGPAYNIGMGGGSASSRSQDSVNQEQDFSAVQRGDPEMANKLVRFVESCCLMEDNPIISIHDQGSGGMANVTREISEPRGAKIFLDNLDLGDKSMNSLEKWVAEYQEQITILIEPINYEIVKNISKRENVPVKVVGYIDNQNKLEVVSEKEINKVVDLPILPESHQKTFPIEKNQEVFTINDCKKKVSDSLVEKIRKIFNHLSVCSKGFLVNKVDRSVTGLIAQQQCVGPFQLPLSNYSIVMGEYLSNEGLVSSIGEKPINGLYDRLSMVEMTLSEMICNMMFAPIKSISSINCVANWMWSSTEPKEAYALRECLDHLVNCVNKMGFSINGGKDSLSMNVKRRKQVIKAPNTLVISGYTNCLNIDKKVTPDLKSTNSTLLLLKLNSKERMGGSIYQDVYNLNPDLKCPRIENFDKLSNIFDKVQRLISYNLILSGHDRSDGGLLTTLFEMSISSGIGVEIYGRGDYLFNEEMGVVIEIENSKLNVVINRLYSYHIIYDIVGRTNRSNHISIIDRGNIIFKDRINSMRLLWSQRSLEMEREQTELNCVEQERKQIISDKKLSYKIDESMVRRLLFYEDNMLPIMNRNKHKIAILRDEGSNGDKEMRAAFYIAGFDVYDISMSDLINEKFNLDEFRGIVFVGGFSYSDVLGAGKGWNSVITRNKNLKLQFDNFYKRDDSFSLGVCNGCQVMSLLGYVEKGITLTNNNSGRFESRFNLVKIEKTNSIFLNDMEGMIMGIWSAHGEGKILGNDDINYPIKYVDNEWNITEKYPYNPNGSKEGRCSFSSKCGRHLAIMPHPERCFLTSQLPYLDENSVLKNMKITPWSIMFKNVYNWCSEHSTV